MAGDGRVLKPALKVPLAVAQPLFQNAAIEKGLMILALPAQRCCRLRGSHARSKRNPPWMFKSSAVAYRNFRVVNGLGDRIICRGGGFHHHLIVAAIVPVGRSSVISIRTAAPPIVIESE